MIDQENSSIIGKRIQFYRKQKHLSRDELVTKTGLSLSSIRRFEGGTRTPRMDDLEKIAHGLDMTLDELLYGRIISYHLKFIEEGGLSNDLAELSTSTRNLAHSILCRNFDLLNESGQKRLLEDSEMYVTHPKYKNEEAIRQYNERLKNAPVREITHPIDANDDYTQAEIDEYDEELQHIGNKKQTDT